MQNKPKAELTAALMLLDTRSMSFDMREIDNRRFMFSPQAGELILGRQYRGGQLYKSHAEEHFDSGAKAPFGAGSAQAGTTWTVLFTSPRILAQTISPPLTMRFPPCKCSAKTARREIPSCAALGASGSSR